MAEGNWVRWPPDIGLVGDGEDQEYGDDKDQEDAGDEDQAEGHDEDQEEVDMVKIKRSPCFFFNIKKLRNRKKAEKANKLGLSLCWRYCFPHFTPDVKMQRF